MYCQIVGCFIMGFALKLKLHRFGKTESRLVEVLFTAVTTGLCGCITSFSSWQLQCNRNFFLQWDLSWGNVVGSHNGGRLLEWFVCMWGGIVVPGSALQLGFYVSSQLYPPVPVPPERGYHLVKTPTAASQSLPLLALSETALLFAFCLTVALVVAVPVVYYPNWIFLSYSAGETLSLQPSVPL
jgi:fluoride ion exporter CrcB/FEX